MRNFLKAMTQILIILLLLDGTVDWAISISYKAHSFLNRLQNGDESRLILPPPQEHFIGGRGKTVTPQNSPYMVAEDGRRGPFPSADKPINRRILLLGASQSFGLGLGDDYSPAAVMQHDIPGLEVLNYAVPGASINSHQLQLDYLIDNAVSFDGILVVNGLLDIDKHCFAPVIPPSPSNALRELYNIIVNNFFPPAISPSACTDPIVAERVARQIYGDMLNLLAAADARHIPITIALPPIIYDHPASSRIYANDVKVQNSAAGYMPTLRVLRRRIADGDERRIIDMSRALDSVEHAYIDISSHFSEEASRVLAHQLESRFLQP